MQSSVRKNASLFESKTAWLFFIVALGGALRIYDLDYQSLWLDEGLQYFVAVENSLAELFLQNASFHPPLSFMINHVFLRIGESDFLLRLPAALFGIASLPLLYVLTRELASPREALFAVLVLAVSPLHIWYSQDARMYSQLVFFSLLSAVLLIQATRRGKMRWWVGYVLASTAGMYTHVFMGLALGGQFLWVLSCQRRHLLSITASGIVVALLFLPWAVSLPYVGDFVKDTTRLGLTGGNTRVGRPGFTWSSTPYTFFTYSAGFSLGPTIAELHENRSMQFILSYLPSILSVAIVFGLLACLGLYAMWKLWGTQAAVFSLLGLCLPIAGVVAYSATTRWATFNVRYTIVAFPYFCLLIGTALSYLTRARRKVGAIALVAVLGISAVSIHNYFTNPRYAKEDVRSAVAFWREMQQEEPLIVFGSTYPAQRYLAANELHRVFAVGFKMDLLKVIDEVFAREPAYSAYVLLARDWHQEREKTIRTTFGAVNEKVYPGVKIFKVYRKRTIEISDVSGDHPGTP